MSYSFATTSLYFSLCLLTAGALDFGQLALARSLVVFNNPMVDDRVGESHLNYYSREPNETDELTFDQSDHRIESDELGFSQAELRLSSTNYAFAIGFASSLPWMHLAVDGHYQLDQMQQLILTTGVGQRRYSGRQAAIDYEISTKVRGSSLLYRRYLSEFFPIYLQAGGGYLFWQGNINPSGVLDPSLIATDPVNGEDAPLSGGDVLTSSFSASGPQLSLNLGFSFQSSSGWFVEYSLVGLARAWLLSTSYTNESRHAKRAIEQRLTDNVSWELFNLKVGLFF